MRLTQFSNFAVRILMYAGLKGHRPSAVSEMAQVYGVSQEHLKKAAAELCQQGSLEAVRGRYGGVQLALAPNEINIGQVIRKTEAVGYLVECFDPATSTCPLSNDCRFRIALQEALEAFFSVLDRYTLADLIEDRNTLLALLNLRDGLTSSTRHSRPGAASAQWCGKALQSHDHLTHE